MCDEPNVLRPHDGDDPVSSLKDETADMKSTNGESIGAESPSSFAPVPAAAPADCAESPFKIPTAFKLAAPVAKRKSAEIEEAAEKKSETDGKEERTEDYEKKEKESKTETKVTTGSKRKSTLDSLTPAEKKKYDSLPMPYKEPSWSGVPRVSFHLEVLKMGRIVDRIDLNTKPFFVFGRLPSCDVPLEHPSLSRFHAVLQYRAVDDGVDCADDKRKGFYLMDLGSTHGTFLNKNQVEANSYIRLKVGHMFKFGGSSRYFILGGGSENDVEEESEFTLTQLKEMQKVREQHLKTKMAEEEEREKAEKERESKGATWGFTEDAVEVDSDDDDENIDMSRNPYAKMSGKAEHEDKYAEDPRKCLQNWFDREGEDLEYEFAEEGTGKKKTFLCRVTLPIDAEEPIVAEAEGSNKKQAKVLAAREACKLLDCRGLLFQSQQESQADRRRKRLEENDYYDSDEDEFLDRTGEIEAKRAKRMRAHGKAEETKALTFAELTTRLGGVRDEMDDIERRLDHAKKRAGEKEGTGAAAEDSLDAFMSAIKSGRSLDTKTRIQMKTRLQELRKERLKLEKLAELARPANVPPLPKTSSFGARGGILVGKMRGRGGGRGGSVLSAMRTAKPLIVPKVDEASVVEEEEEEEEEEEIKGGAEREKSVSLEEEKNEREEVSEVEDSNAKNVKNINEIKNAVEDEAVVRDGEEKEFVDEVDKKDNVNQDVQKDVSANEKKSSSQNFDFIDNDDRNSSRKELGKDSSNPESKKSTRKKKSADAKDDSHVLEDVERQNQPKFSVAKFLSAKAEEAYEEEKMKDPKFAMWTPPVGQTGDGRTKLNEKFGY